MKKSNLLTSAAAVMLLTAAPAAAQTCIKTPSCADLGYTKTAADCSGKTILKCPLDNTQVYCPGYEETLRTYKVGDTYVDANGIGIGTIISLDRSGLHGTIMAGAYAGESPTEVGEYCRAKTAGGLEWGIATTTNTGIYQNRLSECQYLFTTGGCCHICSASNNSCYSNNTSCSGGMCQASF